MFWEKRTNQQFIGETDEQENRREMADLMGAVFDVVR